MSTAVAAYVTPKRDGGIFREIGRWLREFLYEEAYYGRIVHEAGLEKINTLAIRIARERAKGVTMHAGGQEVIRELSKELSLPERFIIMFWWNMVGNFDNY